jgi:flagellar biosynthetic protein FliO
VDSSVTDSTVPANAADSVIQRLAQARSDGQGNQPLDLKFESPAKIFSVKNISMVLIVIGLLVLFMHFLRKYLYKPIGGPAAGGQFQVVRQFHLGPRKSVALVRFAGKLLLLGVTESAINTLAEIDDPEEVERVLADAANPAANAAGAFKDIYHNLLSRSGKGTK